MVTIEEIDQKIVSFCVSFDEKCQYLNVEKKLMKSHMEEQGATIEEMGCELASKVSPRSYETGQDTLEARTRHSSGGK